MDSTLTALVAGIGSGWLIVGYGVRLIFTGGLIPRNTHEDILHDRNEWRAAHRISETARQVAADQVDELLENARTTDAFIRAFPRPSQERT